MRRRLRTHLCATHEQHTSDDDAFVQHAFHALNGDRRCFVRLCERLDICGTSSPAPGIDRNFLLRCLPSAADETETTHEVIAEFGSLDAYLWSFIDDLPALFGECMRVPRPGGFLAFSSFGPDTLKELRAAWAEADQQPHVGRFLDMHDVGDAMLNAGLRDPVLDVFRYTLTYSEPRKLLEELQGLGATNADRARARGLTGKGRYQRMLAAYEAMRVNGRIPASWEVVSAHAWGPPVGQPRRVPGGEIASFSIDSLRGSRRK